MSSTAPPPRPPPPPRPAWHPERLGSALLLALLVAFLALGQAGHLGRPAKRLADDLRNDGPNAADSGHLTRDYYRGLLGDAGGVSKGIPERLSRWLLGLGHEAEVRSDTFATSPIARPGEGFPLRELAPGTSAELAGTRVTVNSHGMRDDECAVETPAGALRLALIGASNDMGWGVRHEETWATRLEALLGAKRGTPVEVLNFAVPSFTLLEQLWTIEERIVRFAPRLLLFTVTLPELRNELIGRLATRIRSGRDLGYDFVRAIVAESGARREDDIDVVQRKLRPYTEALVDGVFTELVKVSRARGLPIAVVILKLEPGGEVARQLRWSADAAERAGLPVIRAFDACRELSAIELYVDPRSDHHPGVAAHAALAAEIAMALDAQSALRAALGKTALPTD